MEIFYPLAHSLKACDGQSWARRSSGKGSRLGEPPAAFPEALAACWMGEGQPDTNGGVG